MPVRVLFALLALALSPALAPGAAAQNLFSVGGEESDDPSPHSEASLVAGVKAVVPGEPFTVGLRIGMDPHWHSYWENAGDAGMPTSIRWALPEGFEASGFSWPYPKRIAIEPLMNYAYEDEVVLLVEVTPPAEISASEVTLGGLASWLICEEVCLPAEEEVALTLPVAAPGTMAQHDPEGGALIDRYRARLPADSPAWAHAAARTDDGFALLLQPGPDAEPDALQGAYFFASTGQTIDHAAEQTLRETADGFALHITGSEYAAGPAERLRGVLVAPEGRTLDGVHRALRIDAPVVESLDAAATGGPEQGGIGLLGALGLAFLGGILLNLMPCVFPILSIKILGFAKSAGDRPATQRRLGWAFAGGVLVSFWALAGLLLALRAAGEGIGWGFQLQSPVFVGAMALLMFGLGLNLLGVFEIGLGVSGRAAQLDRREGVAGAFGSGALATLVATPCTAPLMGAALGWALVQPAAVSLAVFTALGAGMALPYVALTHAPGLAAKLPRPGPWMVRLKQALAFPLFATAVWLVWVFALQAGVDSAALLLCAMLAVAFAGWIVSAWPKHAVAGWSRGLTRTLAGFGVAAAAALLVLGAGQTGPDAAATTGEEAWAPYSAAAVDAARESGRPVFVDFTAAWCLTCQVNKRVALHTESVADAFEQQDVARFRADWTNRDPAITEALADLGRSGVPVYAFYPPGADGPTLLPEVLTPQLVVDALADAAPPVAQR